MAIGRFLSIRPGTRGCAIDSGQAMEIKLSALTPEQALNRAVRNTVGRDICAIAYAKSIGRTAADVGRFIGTLTASYWADIEGKGPGAFAQHLHRFLQTDPTLTFEILTSSKTSVTARHNIYGRSVVELLAPIGVTLEEYVCYYGKQFEAVAEYLGLNYKQELATDWILLNVSTVISRDARLTHVHERDGQVTSSSARTGSLTTQ